MLQHFHSHVSMPLNLVLSCFSSHATPATATLLTLSYSTFKYDRYDRVLIPIDVLRRGWRPWEPGSRMCRMTASSQEQRTTFRIKIDLEGPWVGTPTKRQVSKRQVSKCLVSKRPVSRRQVYKTSGLQNVRFQNVWFQNVQFLNFIYLINKKYRNCQVCIAI